jgi:glycine/D-amino acid oxidase-like deaminating enzyme
VRSNELWRTLDFPGIELEAKGGLVVTTSPEESVALDALAATQTGVASEPVDPHDFEPHLAPDVTGGRFYPEDMQVQPMLAAAALLRASGAFLRLGTTVTSVAEGVVHTSAGPIHTGVIVNAMGVWAGELTGLPVLPRRGFILVTSKVPHLVRHKVYAAGYVAAVGSSSEDLQMSPVVEGTQAGTVLIGSSRERVGFDGTMSLPVLRKLAVAAIRLFPALADVQVIRAYKGFRPYLPDHLPAIGADATRPWLFHACGHEGAGVGLAPITGSLIASLVTGGTPLLDPAPFSPVRFAMEA